MVVLLYSDILNFTFWSIWHFEMWNFLIGFLDELCNFMQKKFYISKCKFFFTFYSNGTLYYIIWPFWKPPWPLVATWFMNAYSQQQSILLSCLLQIHFLTWPFCPWHFFSPKILHSCLHLSALSTSRQWTSGLEALIFSLLHSEGPSCRNSQYTKVKQ